MDHGIRGRKFGRRTAHRSALLMNLVKSLVRHGKITTTVAKAKDLRPVVERMVTLAKKGDLNARRKVVSYMRGSCEEVTILFDKVAKATASRPGGYCRITKIGNRLGDHAPMAMIEFVDIVK